MTPENPTPPDSPNSSPQIEQSAFRRLLPIWIMIGTILAVVISGYLVFPRTDEARNSLLQVIGTKNQGMLLNPVADLNTLELKLLSGQTLEWHSDRPIWSVFVVAQSTCEQSCTELLSDVRLVHARLDKNAHRVERFLVAETSNESAENIQNQFPKLRMLVADPQLRSLMAANNSAELVAPALVYLVDPRGVAMMVYRPDQEPTDLLDDLKHLLKTLP